MKKLLLILSLTVFSGKVFTMEMVSDDELLKKGQSCELAELVYMIEIVKCNQTQDEEKITVCVEKLVDQAKKPFNPSTVK